MTLKAFALFFIINSVFFYFLLRKYLQKKSALAVSIQDLSEKSNILSFQNHHEKETQANLREKIKRYDSLKNIVEEISRRLDVANISESLTALSFSLIAANKGACLLFLTDIRNQARLNLFKTKREDHARVIKEKEGDIFDIWVLKHASPLFVENTKRDFRFDSDKICAAGSRQISSLISAPMITNHRLLGILRIDNTQERYFSQDDLRLLSTIADLGAMAIENAVLYEKTQDLAIHDGLTSFYTKGYFREKLHQEFQHSTHHENQPFSILMLDIDFFKKYNDTFGHSAGDFVLKNLSRIIAESLAEHHPVISRFGGEEFCIILPRMAKKEAVRIAEYLRKKIETEKIFLRREQTCVTVSIGAASFPEDSLEENDLLLKADQAMYTAKKRGRNRVCVI